MSHRFEAPHPPRGFGHGPERSWDPPRPRSADGREGINDRDQNGNHHSPREPPTSFPPKISIPMPPKADNLGSRSKHSGPFSKSPSSTPTKPSPKNNGSPTRDITKAFLHYGELVAERASLNLQQDSLDRSVKQRKLEYDKSMQRHPEFQSVPELQNKFRDRQSREVKRLEDLRRGHEQKYMHAAERVASQVLNGLPLVPREAEVQPPGGVSYKLASLKNQIQQLKDTFKNQMARQENMHASELATQRKDYTSQLANQQLAFEKQMEQLREDTLARQTAQEIRQAEQERRQVQLEKRQVEQEQRQIEQGKRQADREKCQLEDMKAQFSKHHEQLRTLVQDQEVKQELSTQAKTSAEGLAALHSENASLKADLATLHSENASLRSDLSALLGRVDGVARELAQCKDEIRPLNVSLLECFETANETRSMLSSVDFGGIDHIAEVLVSEWPSQQTKVAELERRLDEVFRGHLPSQQTKVAELERRLDEVVRGHLPSQQTKVAELEKRLDEVSRGHQPSEQTKVAELEKRLDEVSRARQPSEQTKVAELEKRLEEVSRARQPSQAPTAKADDGTLARTVEDISQRVDQVKQVQDQMGTLWGGMLDELDKAMSSLAHRTKNLEELAANPRRPSPSVDVIRGTADRLEQNFVKLTEKVEGASVKMEQECEYLNHKFMTLDTQFNNISTRGLAEHIIAQMEQFYPNNAQIVADIDALNKLVQELKMRWAELGKEQLTMRHAFDKISGHIDHVYADQPPGGSKRRRVDLGSNGDEHQHQANGTS